LTAIRECVAVEAVPYGQAAWQEPDCGKLELNVDDPTDEEYALKNEE